jgi:hypothetical protein
MLHSFSGLEPPDHRAPQEYRINMATHLPDVPRTQVAHRPITAEYVSLEDADIIMEEITEGLFATLFKHHNAPAEPEHHANTNVKKHPKCKALQPAHDEGETHVHYHPGLKMFHGIVNGERMKKAMPERTF